MVAFVHSPETADTISGSVFISRGKIIFQLGNSESLFVKMIKFLPSSNCLIKDFVENDLKCFLSAEAPRRVMR